MTWDRLVVFMGSPVYSIIKDMLVMIEDKYGIIVTFLPYLGYVVTSQDLRKKMFSSFFFCHIVAKS